MPTADSCEPSRDNHRARRGRAVIIMAACWIAMILTACSIIASPSKKVAGQYYLIQWEDFTTYFLEDRASLEAGSMPGAILRIGWSDRQIVYKRERFKGTSETDWKVIDVETHEVRGPFSEEQIIKMKEESPALGSIKIYEVEDAWRTLR